VNSKSGISDCPSFAIGMIGWPGCLAIHQTDERQLTDSLRTRRRIALLAATAIEPIQIVALKPHLNGYANCHWCASMQPAI
jgi:hypothetical protein